MQKIIKTDVPLVKDMVCEVQQECEVRQEWSSDCPCCAQRFWKLILASTTIAKTLNTRQKAKTMSTHHHTMRCS